MKIHGKEYMEVKDRITFFRKNYEDGQIITTMLPSGDGMCIFKVEVFIGGVLKATGHAYEKEGSTQVNTTSYVENCETSAVGRALGILGIGIDGSVASAEEVANAIKQQNAPEEKMITPDQIEQLIAMLPAADMSQKELEKTLKCNISELTEARFKAGETWLRGEIAKLDEDRA